MIDATLRALARRWTGWRYCEECGHFGRAWRFALSDTCTACYLDIMDWASRHGIVLCWPADDGGEQPNDD